MYALSAGGTGGHVFPALSVAKHIGCLFITDQRGEKYISKTSLQNICVIASEAKQSLRGEKKFSTEITTPFSKARDDEDVLCEVLQIRRDRRYAWDILKGITTCIHLFRKHKVKAVMGFGGYPSVPACLASAILRIPFAIHEQNASLGRANRLLSLLTPHLFTSFPHSKGIHSGNPVRETLLSLADSPYIAPNQSSVNCLILGGSQGSRELSYMVPECIPHGFIVRHQARTEDLEMVRTFYQNRRIEAAVQPFFEDMQDHYRWAHLVIARAGASTIAELAIAKRPAILIPFAQGGQNENAEALREAVIVCRTKEDLKKGIEHMTKNLPLYSERISSFAKPHATEELMKWLSQH